MAEIGNRDVVLVYSALYLVLWFYSKLNGPSKGRCLIKVKSFNENETIIYTTIKIGKQTYSRCLQENVLQAEYTLGLGLKCSECLHFETIEMFSLVMIPAILNGVILPTVNGHYRSFTLSGRRWCLSPPASSDEFQLRFKTLIWYFMQLIIVFVTLITTNLQWNDLTFQVCLGVSCLCIDW